MIIPTKAPFAQLTQPQRRAVIAWADSHDWGQERDATWTTNLETGQLALSVQCAFVDEHGDWGLETFLAGSFDELRAWAGY